MSSIKKNVLYLGSNRELVEALLHSLSDGNKKVSYQIEHRVCSDEVLNLLHENKHHYFITEQLIPQVTVDKIARLFPTLKTTYLKPSATVNASSMQTSLNDDVKPALNETEQEPHFIEIKKVPLSDDSDSDHGLIGAGYDIVTHRRLQKRLKVANAVFENSHENILMVDHTGKIISINRAACRLFGYSKIELLDKPVKMLSTQDPDSMILRKATRKIKEDGAWSGDMTYRHKQGGIGFAWLDIYVVELEKGMNNRIYTFTDLSLNKKSESKIKYLSQHDPLTGLSNRIALFTKLEDTIHRANINENTMAAVLINLNGFKGINDQYGHNEGDKVLQEIACRLANCVAEKDTLARLGDDEFVIIVDVLKNEHDAALVAQKIINQFNRPFEISNITTKLTVSIGISLCPDDGDDVDTLLQHAEKAMLRAKRDKNISYRFYTDHLTKHSSDQLQLEAELKIAIEEDQFELQYQPQYDLNKKLVVGMESLWRWNHPQHGEIFPDQFLSLAEESGLIIPLGLKMLEKVALQTIKWKKAHIFFGRIAFYLSLKQLEQISLIADIQTIIKDTGCLVSDIEFEIYESVFNSESYVVRDNLFNINKLGIAITVVGFGTDVPIFHFIEPLSIEKFKIADDYIKHVPGRIISQAMIQSIRVFARELGINIVGNLMDGIEQEVFSSETQEISKNDAQVKPMKVGEATFYLRCNKKK
ncbi:MAG: diguanylate cyclase [Psychromonas sp.]